MAPARLTGLHGARRHSDNDDRCPPRPKGRGADELTKAVEATMTPTAGRGLQPRPDLSLADPRAFRAQRFQMLLRALGSQRRERSQSTRRYQMADHKAIAQRWYNEVMSQGKTEVIDELCTPDWHRPQSVPRYQPRLRGPEGFRHPDPRGVPRPAADRRRDDREGDRLAVRSTMRAPTKAASWASRQRQEGRGLER